MAAIDQPRDDRHDERDVAAALKHREEDSGWLCHLRLVGSVSGLLLNSLDLTHPVSGRGERTRASGPLDWVVRRRRDRPVYQRRPRRRLASLT